MTSDIPGDNQAQPADLHILEGQFGGETTRELVKAYLEDTGKTLDGMQEAMIGRDLKAVKALAHMLKSASRIVGAMQLSAYSKQMEDLCGQGQWLPIESFYETFSASFEATAEYLRQYLK
jgi:HPt (histidine-containing phosphotransfer) domain-containing protein